MEQIPGWVYIILALFAGLFGNQFLGKLIAQWQSHEQDKDQHEQAQANELLKAVIDMVRTQSKDLTALLQESLASNQVMANNIGQLAMAIEGGGRDSHNQFLIVKDSLDGVSLGLAKMSDKVDTTNDYTAAVIRAIGGNLDVLLVDVERDKANGEELRNGD